MSEVTPLFWATEDEAFSSKFNRRFGVRLVEADVTAMDPQWLLLLLLWFWLDVGTTKFLALAYKCATLARFTMILC